MPRKTAARHVPRRPAVNASMRPRPDAAENGMPDRRPSQPLDASMRPRPDAAENHHRFLILNGIRTMLQ